MKRPLISWIESALKRAEVERFQCGSPTATGGTTIMHSDSNLKSIDAPLVDYRLYALNERNRIFAPARQISAVDDERAIEMTAGFPDGRAIELWQQDRLVFRLTPNKSNPIVLSGPRIQPLNA
jgi:hypothetical protein